jgi:hypothetical protein
MGVSVAPSYGAFLERFPEFGQSVTQALYNNLFAEAETFVRNDGAGPVRSATTQQILLNYVVAHLAKLFATSPDGSPPQASQIPGRLSAATEGSVNITVDYTATNNEQFWALTGYGIAYWRMSASFRTFRYKPARSRWGGWCA